MAQLALALSLPAGLDDTPSPERPSDQSRRALWLTQYAHIILSCCLQEELLAKDERIGAFRNELDDLLTIVTKVSCELLTRVRTNCDKKEKP